MEKLEYHEITAGIVPAKPAVRNASVRLFCWEGLHMHQETFQEKKFHDLLPPDLGEAAQISFGDRHILEIIQGHLQTFYGECAEWPRCIAAYFHSAEYQKQCHTVKRCADIPLITPEQLYAMLQDEQRDREWIQSFLQLNQKIKDEKREDDIFRAAEMLGIAPNQKAPGLFSWLISRKGLTAREMEEIHQKISKNLQLFALVIDLFSTLFVPGMQLTFPCVGTVMTQQRSRYFYRGENAFYGSSKPGIFRAAGPISWVKSLADRLILDEACSFLDQFDAVEKWGVSTVNYLALAQHYGIQTPLLDITSDLKTALFFACCKYEAGQWHPLQKKDFASAERGSGPVDTRYGILYRTPTEITDMKLTSATEENGIDLIIPIGYQPFMRCSAQHGYMLWAKNAAYDLLQDPLFDKFRIEHSEEFCRWIFEEMDCGAKIYPHDDMPKIESYMQQIRTSHRISQSTFARLSEDLHWSEKEVQAVKQALQKEGYTILGGENTYIHYNKLRKINRQYSAEIACKKLGDFPVMRPMLIISGDTTVESGEDNAVQIAP